MYISNYKHFRVLFLLCAEFFMLHESAFCRFTAFQISIKIASIVFWYFCCRYCCSHSLLICSHIFNSTSLDTHDTWFYESKTYKEIKKKNDINTLSFNSFDMFSDTGWNGRYIKSIFACGTIQSWSTTDRTEK